MKKTISAFAIVLLTSSIAFAQKDPPTPPPPPPPVCDYGTVVITNCAPDQSVCPAFLTKNAPPCPFNVCTSTTQCAPPPPPQPPVRGR